MATIDHMEKFQITDRPKVWVSGFMGVNGNGISASAIMKKLKKGHHFVNIDHMEKFQITDLPKFGPLVFQVSTEKENTVLAIMKKLKNCHHFTYQ